MFSSSNPKFFAVRHIHYPVNTSSDHFHTDAVVSSIVIIAALGQYCHLVRETSDQYIVVPSSDHYGNTKVINETFTKSLGAMAPVPPSLAISQWAFA